MNDGGKSQRRRLDVALVERGIVPTRARARDAILRGAIIVDGEAARRPAMMVSAHATIDAYDPAGRYVSRAALKLEAGLDHFGYDPAGLSVLDIGASTGGFTELLIQRGAERVYAVDVGHDQLHQRLRDHPAVRNREGLNARDLTAGHVHGQVDAVVSDVSFISLTLALPPALSLAAPGADFVGLFKPQFEVGREHVGKGGIVTDIAAADAAAGRFTHWMKDKGWPIHAWTASPISGGDGNAERLFHAMKA